MSEKTTPEEKPAAKRSGSDPAGVRRGLSVRRWLLVAGVAAVLAVPVLVVGVWYGILPSEMGTQQTLAFLNRQLTNFSNLRLRTDQVQPTVTGLDLRGVRVEVRTEDDWSPLLTAPQVEVGVSVWDLVLRRAQTFEVRMSEPVFTLAFDDSGRAITPKFRGGDDKPKTEPSPESGNALRVVLEEASFLVARPDESQEWWLDGTLDVGARPSGGAYEIEIREGSGFLPQLGLVVTELTGNGEASTEQVQVSDLRVVTDAGVLAGQGRMGSGEIDIELEADRWPWEFLAEILEQPFVDVPGDLAVRARVTGSLDAPVVETTLEGVWREETFTTDLRGRLADEGVVLENARLTWAGTSVSGSGLFQFDGNWDLDAQVRHLDLSRLERLAPALSLPESDFGGPVRVRSRQGRLEVEHMGLEGQLAGISVDSLGVVWSYDAGVVEWRSRGGLAHGVASINGLWDGTELDINANGTQIDVRDFGSLHFLLDDFQRGKGTVSLTLRGPPSRLELNGAARLIDARWRNIDSELLGGRFGGTLGKGVDSIGVRGSARRGAVGLASCGYAGDGSRLEQYLDHRDRPACGPIRYHPDTLSRRRARRGSMDSLVLAGRAPRRRADSSGAGAGTPAHRAARDPFRVAASRRGDGCSGDCRRVVAGSQDGPGSECDAARCLGHSTVLARNVLGWPGRSHGRSGRRGRLNSRSNWRAPPIPSSCVARAWMPPPSDSAPSATAISSRCKSSSGEAIKEMQTPNSSRVGRGTTWGSASGWSVLSSQRTGVARSPYDLSTWRSGARSSMSPPSGKGIAELELELGPPGERRRGKSSGSIEDLAWNGYRVEEAEWEIALRDDRLHIDEFALRIEDESLRVEGEIPLVLAWHEGSRAWFPDRPMRLDVEIPEAGLPYLPLFLPQIAAAEGKLESNLRFEGTPANPLVYGSVHVREGALRVSGREEIYRDVEIDAELTGDRIEMARIEARQHSDGKIEGKGWFQLSGENSGAYQLDLVATNALAQASGEYAVSFDGEFVISDGPRFERQLLATPMVRGALRVRSGVVLYDFADPDNVVYFTGPQQAPAYVYEIEIDAPRRAFWRTPSANIEMSVDMTMSQTIDQLKMWGRIESIRGHLLFLGEQIRCRARRARVRFGGIARPEDRHRVADDGDPLARGGTVRKRGDSH